MEEHATFPLHAAFRLDLLYEIISFAHPSSAEEEAKEIEGEESLAEARQRGSS